MRDRISKRVDEYASICRRLLVGNDGNGYEDRKIRAFPGFYGPRGASHTSGQILPRLTDGIRTESRRSERARACSARGTTLTTLNFIR